MAYIKYPESKQKFYSYQVFLKQYISYAETFHVIKYIPPPMFKVNLLKVSPHLVSNFLFPLKVLCKFHIAFLGLTQDTRMVSKVNHHV